MTFLNNTIYSGFRKLRPLFSYLAILSVGLLYSGCYSFKGITINCTELKTFSIVTFENNAPNVPPTLGIEVTEALKLKVISESCLTATTANGDVEFKGEVVGYDVSAVAPQPGETSTFNRLTVTVMVEYINSTSEKDSFRQRFSWFEDFSTDQNLIDVQDDLIESINKQLVELIFNKAFTNW